MIDRRKKRVIVLGLAPEWWLSSRHFSIKQIWISNNYDNFFTSSSSTKLVTPSSRFVPCWRRAPPLWLNDFFLNDLDAAFLAVKHSQFFSTQSQPNVHLKYEMWRETKSFSFLLFLRSSVKWWTRDEWVWKKRRRWKMSFACKFRLDFFFVAAVSVHHVGRCLWPSLHNKLTVNGTFIDRLFACSD